MKFSRITNKLQLSHLFCFFKMHMIPAPHSQFLGLEYLCLPAPSITPVYHYFLRSTFSGLPFSPCGVLLPSLPLQSLWNRPRHSQLATQRVSCSRKSFGAHCTEAKLQQTTSHFLEDYQQFTEGMHN